MKSKKNKKKETIEENKPEETIKENKPEETIETNFFINNKVVHIIDNIIEITREKKQTDIMINWIPNYFQGKKLESLSGTISIDMGIESTYTLTNKYISHMFIR